MTFQDVTLIGGLIGKEVTGLTITKTAAMTLEVATGTVYLHNTGVTYTFSPLQNHIFAADSTRKRFVKISIIDNGSTTDLWIDDFIDDKKTGPKVDPPSGYILVHELAWFEMPAAITDLNSTTIYRRILI